MSLKQIREKVKSISDYDPTLLAYSNQLDELINSAYTSLWLEHRWTFAQRLKFVDLMPDLSPALPGGGLSAITAAYVDGQRTVIFSAAIPILLNRREEWEGNIITLAGRDYTILSVISATQITVDVPIRIIAGAASVTGSADWHIKQRFHRLPEDAIEILTLAHRDAPTEIGGPVGRIYGVPNGRDADLNLRQDLTSTYADLYVPIPPISVPPAEKIGAAFNQVVDNSGDGDLPQGKFFELCWAFVGPDGSVGPLSQPSIFQVPTDAQAPSKKYDMDVSFLTFDDKPVASKNTSYTAGPGTRRPLEGYRKKLYYNQYFNPATGDRLGNPLWRELIVGFNTNTGAVLNNSIQDNVLFAEDTESGITITNLNSMDPGTKQYIERDGQYFRYRLYPRPDAFDYAYDFSAVDGVTPSRDQDFFRQIELRYLFKPKNLVSDTDTPEMPWEFQNLICWKALEDMFMKNGDIRMADYYRKKTEKELKTLSERYTSRVDVNYLRGQWGSARSSVYNIDYRSYRKTN